MGLIFITASERSVACGSAKHRTTTFFASVGNATLAYGYESNCLSGKWVFYIKIIHNLLFHISEKSCIFAKIGKKVIL